MLKRLVPVQPSAYWLRARSTLLYNLNLNPVILILLEELVKSGMMGVRLKGTMYDMGNPNALRNCVRYFSK